MNCVIRHLATRSIRAWRTQCSNSLIRYAIAVSNTCFDSSAMVLS